MIYQFKSQALLLTVAFWTKQDASDSQVHLWTGKEVVNPLTQSHKSLPFFFNFSIKCLHMTTEWSNKYPLCANAWMCLILSSSLSPLGLSLWV